MIFVVALERWRRRTGKNPLAILLLLEQSRWHRCAGADGLRIGNPALDPIRLQALLCEQEVGRGGDLVVLRIAGSVTL